MYLYIYIYIVEYMVVEISVIFMNIMMPGVNLFRVVFRYYSLP